MCPLFVGGTATEGTGQQAAQGGGSVCANTQAITQVCIHSDYADLARRAEQVTQLAGEKLLIPDTVCQLRNCCTDILVVENVLR